ncbi:MAG TPA: hypothetical protein VLT62_17430 [Candidatus Methylomirabilis sp.]|nr:hypothetical protein [Candidatus Methylomirabilis sp.]
MAPLHRAEYNPIILGFVENEGYVEIPLQTAREEYGRLPSQYGLVSNARNRRERKTLNLSLGLAVLKHFREGRGLTEPIARFYERWGRDFRADFQVGLDRFLSRNDPSVLKRVVEDNSRTLTEYQRVDLREVLRARKLISPSTLQSIPPDELLPKTHAILSKKARNPAHSADLEAIAETLALVQAKRSLEELAALTGGNLITFGMARLAIHADEVSRILQELARWIPLVGVERVSSVQGRDVEFALAPRDPSFLDLGKEVGDCTADKTFRQVDREVENIYWTVFAWFLDRHYQILKVYHDGQFILKVHLLPLLVFTRTGETVLLAVDAIETTPAFREDTPLGRPDLLDKKESIFARVMEEVVRIGQSMGIATVCAEKFSNTGWVRRELARFPEIYFHIGGVRKIDELEDVFELAKRVCATAAEEPPTSVFMELQVKNTYLLRGAASVKGMKAYALISGDPGIGVPLKQAVGV